MGSKELYKTHFREMVSHIGSKELYKTHFREIVSI